MLRPRLAAFAASIALAAVPASAAVVIKPGASFLQPDQNVLTDTSMTAATVMGSTNHSDTSVSVQGLGGDILTTTGSNGQARFEASDGRLDSAQISLTNGGTFQSAEFNLFNPYREAMWVTISAAGVSQDFMLSRGQNFFGISASDGSALSSIVFDTNGMGVADLRQLRLGGVVAAAAPVPEPATWAMMLLGFITIGATMRRGRRQLIPQFG